MTFTLFQKHIQHSCMNTD
uniref:Uncharacterized protein n=1 Tax=Anguilla anguilla TaxID=7936 RepID=A0A0E9U1G5_ANGAN